MATETVALEKETNQEMWSGGQSPFKASYGKLMMWYFLLSDAFTFSALLITYGMIRFKNPAFEGNPEDFIFSQENLQSYLNSITIGSVLL